MPDAGLVLSYLIATVQKTGSSLRNISSCLKVGISVAPDFWQTGAENESTFVGNCGKRSNIQAFNENMNLRKPIYYIVCKVNSVQEACAKFERNEAKNISFSPIDLSSIFMFFVLLFQVFCKILNFDKSTARHLAQASCTDLTLLVDLVFKIKKFL